MEINQITREILGCAFDVHTELGPGLLESAYEHALAFELRNKDFEIEVQKALPLVYKGNKLDCGYRIDILVQKKVIIEIKAVDKIHDIHKAQILSYMKLSNIDYGLLINFNVFRLKQGISRFTLAK